jgi:hypothetical protein
MLKGRVAEQMIQDLFLNGGYIVSNYGLERIHAHLHCPAPSNHHEPATCMVYSELCGGVLSFSG